MIICQLSLLHILLYNLLVQNVKLKERRKGPRVCQPRRQVQVGHAQGGRTALQKQVRLHAASGLSVSPASIVIRPQSIPTIAIPSSSILFHRQLRLLSGSEETAS